MRQETLYLIDGPGLAYRSYFAFVRNPLTTSKGEQTSVTFGFARALAKIAEEGKPDYWAVAFDCAVPTFRHEEFADYKANRPEMPEDMRPQLERVQQLLDAMRVPSLAVEGYEADDLIGTLAAKAAAAGLRVVLVTEDKDFYQLVDDRILVQVPAKGARGERAMDAAAVRAKLGVAPAQVVDWLALVGDASDNVPGVKGIGPKTATKLLERFGSLEELYRRIGEVEPPRLRDRLEEHREDAFMSRRLVSLALDAPVELDLEALRRRPPDNARLRELLEELEFRGLAESLVGGTGPRWQAAGRSAPLSSYLAGGGPGERWAVALEAPTAGDLAAAVCRTGEPPAGAEFSTESVEDTRRFLADPSRLKVFHDLKSQARLVREAGVDVKGAVGDVMLASYLLEPEAGHSLEAIAERVLGPSAVVSAEAEAPDKLLWRAWAIQELDTALMRRVADAGMKELLEQVEVPLALVLREMEDTGVALDLDALLALSARLEERIRRSEEDIYCMAGVKFNVNSPQQLSEVLFRHLGLAPGRRTKTGYSTDSVVLEQLATDHELPREILNYRQLVKLKSTYVDALPRLVNPATGRVHARFHQAVTATGRLSSSNPNLQNIPIRTELGREIRKAFVPGRAGWSLLSADYSQIELRIMAHMSGDPSLREAFLRGEDVHAATAAAVFGVPLEEVGEELRSKAKIVNYGVMYGMGPAGLARTLGIAREAAARFIEDYFAKMPGVRAFLEDLVERARRERCARTILNRRRPLPAIVSEDRVARAAAERMAVNTPLQGSAADIIKKAMVRIHRTMRERGVRSRMILQVHDELLFECPDRELAEIGEMVRGIMETVVELSVPLSVEVRAGNNWCEIHR